MAVMGPCPLPYTLVAAADLSTYQWAPIKVDASGKANVAHDPGDFAGVLENKPRSTEHATVQFGPCVTKGRAGLAITAGNYVTVQSGGWFIPGNKAIFSVSSWVNANSKTGVVGQALETVASGANFTCRFFSTAVVVNSI